MGIGQQFIGVPFDPIDSRRRGALNISRD